MFNILQWWRALRLPKIAIIVEDVQNSDIKINQYNNPTIVNRSELNISTEWFERLYQLYYDDEIKLKYIPELHHIGVLETQGLQYLLREKDHRKDLVKILKDSQLSLNNFKNNLDKIEKIIREEEILPVLPLHSDWDEIQSLKTEYSVYKQALNAAALVINKNDLIGIHSLPKLPQSVKNIKTSGQRMVPWRKFFKSEPRDKHILTLAFRHYNSFANRYSDLTLIVNRLISDGNIKIIAGNAGTGKTHISAHLVKELRAQGHLVIFLKPKFFNGDQIDFDKKFMQLLDIPEKYSLSETLVKLNNFANTHNKRCVIIIDALNETTKSTIGFSNIWKNDLQRFMNHIAGYSNLYLVCTLRSSYIEHIWEHRPTQIVTAQGYQQYDVKAACETYFGYYKINALNLETADLSYFKIPLLLDLFCKLTNEKREREVNVTLDVHSYLQIFEDYIRQLVSEVKRKINIHKERPILQGFSTSSEMFLKDNEAIISTQDFNDAFDTGDLISSDKSVARAVLEGYLIFIRDFIGKKEIIKHTQQEVGGYLIAKLWAEKYADINELIATDDFQVKIIGTDESKHHQLRLDILKFLIAMKPELSELVNNEDVTKLSWWYLFNGYDLCSVKLPTHLTSLATPEDIRYVLRISGNHWINPSHPFNFHFIAGLLNKLQQPEFDTEWTAYIYENGDFFTEFVNRNLDRIATNDIKEDDYELLVGSFIAFTNATTILTLRNFATIYLIELGKKYPNLLLQIVLINVDVKDSYVYERMISSCYGVALNLQHDNDFIKNHLPNYAKELFALQFAEVPSKSVYNYIVIDSIKHLLDLAVLKGAIIFDDTTTGRIANYLTNILPEWETPTAEQLQIIHNSRETSWPSPIGMDFGIYTIDRLAKEDTITHRESIANVYKRILELGYDVERFDSSPDPLFHNFLRGQKFLGRDKIVERLGKKYSWMAFFDFAGFLLQNHLLEGISDLDANEVFFDRLSDVDIDVSLPSQEYFIGKQIYPYSLTAERKTDAAWTKHNKTESLVPFFQHDIGGLWATMLYGKVDQLVNDDYKIRSFLMVETCFIKAGSDISDLKSKVQGQNFDWKYDIHMGQDRIRHTYFGELYWSDNIITSDLETAGVPTGAMIERSRRRSFMEMAKDQIPYDQANLKIKETVMEKFYFESEPSLSEYLWESDSDQLMGFNEYFPSIRMAQSLNLKSDARTGRVLDTNLQPAFFCVRYEDGKGSENRFNYLRNDLLAEYMKNNELTLLFQIKQHSYDSDKLQDRYMQYHFLNYNDLM